MRSKNRKNIILVGISFLLLLSVSVGFAYLTKRLQINGATSIEKSSWIIYFDEAVEREGSVEATKELTIDETKTYVDFGMTLEMPGDFYEFDINVVNDGSVDAMIDTVVQVGIDENKEKYISYTATYSDGTPIKHCDLLAAGAREKVRVRVEFKEVDKKEDLPESDVDLILELRLNYIQADGCAVAPVVKRSIFVNPNGGEYKGSSAITTIQGNLEEEITLETPTRKAAEFIGWQLKDGNMLEGNTIKLGTEDITIKALWEISGDVVARIEENYYLTLQEAFDNAVSNDIIYLLKEVTENPNNNKEVTLDLGTYKVNGTLTNSGDIKVINGTIESTSGAAIINKGTFTLGSNDSEVKTDGVALIGTTIGIDQQGVFNFYDGYIEGKVGIKGEYNEIPENYFVFVDRNDQKDCQKIYLTETPTRAVAKTITGGDVYYFNLQDAINTSVVTGFNIYAIRDFEAAYTLTVNESESTRFDITGYEVDFGNDVTNNGTLTITNSNREQGKLNVSRPIINNVTLNVENININQTTPANIIENQGTLNIKASTLKALAGYALNANGGTLNIDDESYLQANTYGLHIPSGKEFTLASGNIVGVNNFGTLTINEGSHITNKGSYSIYNNGALTINGGIIESTNTAIYNAYNTITLNKGTINGSTAIYGYRGTININGGEIQASKVGVQEHDLTSPIQVNMTGGKVVVSCETSGCSGTGVYVSKFTMREGEILVNGKGSVTGVNLNTYAGNGSITGGSIIATSESGTGVGLSGYGTIEGGYIYGSTYGIRVTKNTTIGKKDGEINTETPVIIGGLFGLYNDFTTSSYIYFYDGILKGQTGGYYGTINAIEDGTKIVNNSETIEEVEYKTTYLVEEKNYLRIGEKEYNSLSKAIDAIESEGTIVVTANNIVGDVVTIPSEKNVTLDLNGKELQISSTITNNGILTIDDTSEEKNGKILNNVTTIIINNKTLIITNGTISCLASSSSYYTVNNNSNLTINGGAIENTNTTIYNSYDGTITLNDGTIKGSTGIHSKRGTINIVGGEIQASVVGIEGDSRDYSYPTVNMNDGKVKVRCETNNCSAYGVLTVNSLTMTGGEILVIANATGIGVSMRNLGTITGGYIYGSTYGIQVDSSITIGEKGGSINIESPVIVGGLYGLYNNSSKNVYFYDGVLKGQIAGYYGAISGIEDGARIVNDSETIEEVEYKMTYLVEEENYLRIGEKEYNSLSKAIDAIENEGTIVVTANNIVGDVVTIPSEKNITLDLNNYELQFNSTITNNGTLTIDDTSEEKNGKISNNVTTTITNDKILIIANGTISCLANSSFSYVVTNNNGNSNLTINGGAIENTNTAIYNNYGGTITLNNGTIKGSTGIYSRRGTINIGGGEIQASITGIEGDSRDYSYPNINMTDGKVKVRCETNNCSAYGVLTVESLTMTGGEILVIGNATGIGISMRNLGTIIGGYIYGSTYGIQVDSSITIGEKDGSINTESPMIIGGLYGLYNSASKSVYFYDGILKGQTAGYYGAIDEVEEEARIEETIERVENDDYIVNKLVLNNYIIENSTTSKQYRSIQTAIEESNSGDTLKLLDNVSNYFVVPISTDKDITLDLNGYEFYTTKKFENKGTLTITDASETSSELKTIAAVNIITNEGTLNINKIKLSNTASSFIIINKGVANLSNVSIKGVYGIQNESTGTLALNNPNIEITQIGVENRGKIEVEGGNVKGNTGIYLYSGTETNTFKNITIEGTFYKTSTEETTIINATLHSISNNKGTLTIEECTLNNNIDNNSNATLTLNRGTQNNGYISNSGTMTINDLTGINNYNPINGSEYKFITNTSLGTLNINNMNIEFNRNNCVGITSAFYNSGSLYINNSSIKLDDKTDNNNTLYGLYNYDSGNAIITDTTISVTNGGTSYGIYINNGTVTLGEKESLKSENYGTENANVSIESPLIRGIGAFTGIGVKKVSGYFNYYDGKIVGSTNAKPDITTEVEYNYEVATKTEEETSYEYTILEYIK